MDEALMNQIIEDVLAQLSGDQKDTKDERQAASERPVKPFEPSVPTQTRRGSAPQCAEAAPPPIKAPEPLDITSQEARGIPLVETPEDYDALMRMKGKTPARIGVGRAGVRLKTQTLLTLRADHAAARDAVFLDVDEALLTRLGLFSVQTKCTEKNEFLTRPDLGKQLPEAAEQKILEHCKPGADVQIIVSDGLSSTAIEANAENILPAITDSLQDKGYTVGTPFFVKYGRVAVQDAISELLGAKVVCILIGERPGLATAESMSAYIAYKATVGMPEARRTVVSNIHKGGINAAEAGVYIADVIELIMKAKTSGVDLKK